jgi:hypothetical protein
VQARHCHLPDGFDQWDLADGDGWTVAHEAAKWGHSPPPPGWDEKVLGLKDRHGLTVRMTLGHFNYFPESRYEQTTSEEIIKCEKALSEYEHYYPSDFDEIY